MAAIPAVAEKAPDPAQGGWLGALELGFAPGRGRTIMKRHSHLGPFVVQSPFYPEGAPCHAYLLHPPGGLVGGDRLQLEVGCAPGAHCLITTPAHQISLAAAPPWWHRPAKRLGLLSVVVLALLIGNAIPPRRQWG